MHSGEHEPRVAEVLAPLAPARLQRRARAQVACRRFQGLCMFYKVVVTVWDIKQQEKRREGAVFLFFNTFNTGGGGEARAEGGGGGGGQL